ncbi:dynamin family protein [Falsibacillus albus]|uniref:Dynamin N-terminal domain-containing protein n=1 Tax=Falsibacillus albus TaxID=2478915 RepID=A0A3L7JXY0_9BACI|nr:dynamin family protein [Falsibacillus albus]RLQ95155.1 hypothetical protein D9X91_11705 [Falsibacillus albus]
MEKVSQHSLLNQAIELYEKLIKNEDYTTAEKAMLLIKKVYQKEFIIAFTGHFSAGKSTLINNLLGEQVLPSSPIPTSANLVKIHSGSQDFAKVNYRNDRSLLFQSPYDFEMIKGFCRNGEEVESIEIERSETNIPHGITIMDTPGVDSTDEAHRISTESAIHLADIVFYVMDYNHVQSELNFVYTKDLLKHGAELYLIVNQIDKHREEELSFSDFKKSVRNSFESWEVHPKEIFFTSAKDVSGPENQLIELKKIIRKTLEEKEKHLDASASTAIAKLEKEHMEWLLQSEEELASPYREKLSTIPENEYLQLIEKEDSLKEEIASLENRDHAWTEKMGTASTEILKNAYLMPFETRSLAEKYLESVQPDFKVGLLFGKKKTEAEREARLNDFYQGLKGQVQTQLEWHLRQLFAEEYKQLNLNSPEVQSASQNLSVPFDKGLITETVKSGARLSGDYVLNYCNDLVEKLKKIAKTEINSLVDKFLIEIRSQDSGQIDQLESKLSSLLPMSEAVRQLMRIGDERANKESDFNLALTITDQEYQKWLEKLEHDRKDVEIYNPDKVISTKQAPINEKSPQVQAERMVSTSISLEDMTNKLVKASDLLKDKIGFERMAKSLAQKADRLGNQSFTIALFGAFSAGKSSFANALLGKGVLPVSPNPTTAAINRICPPTRDFTHGTAQVHFKSRENMLADVKRSLNIFNEDCRDFEDALEIIPKINMKKIEGKEKVHLSFLNAFLDGFLQHSKHLDEALKTDLEGFRGYVANESQSCFVEAIDLYFESEFTKQGITLVDTPGADSINARHTGVSFEYIKNSDAILFVTYYNHAFSKADREFLIQLGRVKDAFELDKMFFIVNAVDLADSNQEKEEVLEYVHGQLQEYGIRKPRLFGVSSLLALGDEADRNQSFMHHFKDEFNRFLSDDLTAMAIESSEREWNKAVERVDQLIDASKQSQEDKAEKREKLIKLQHQLGDLFRETSSEFMKTSLQQEADELVHYVHQRVFFRFSDFFKESFNPALLNKNDRSLLEKALKDLTATLSFDLSQEMRSTSLRLENHAKRALGQEFSRLQEVCRKVESELVFTQFEPQSLETIKYPEAFSESDLEEMKKTFKYFKNPKAFFEKGEKKVMQEKLETILKPLSEEYLSIQKKETAAFLFEYLDEQLHDLIEAMKDDANDQINGWLNVLDVEVNMDDWLEVRRVLTEE